MNEWRLAHPSRFPSTGNRQPATGKECPGRTPDSYEKLDVYQLSIALVSTVLAITRTFPRNERYELVSQIRRAAMSIPSNIVEGNSRRSRKEYLHFVTIAYGSCRELATHLEISRAQNYMSDAEYQEINSKRDRVAAMLWKLKRYLEKEIER